MQFAFFCPPLRGHLDPMFAVAARLRDRGHRIAFVGIEDIAPRVAAAGFEMSTVGAESHPAGRLPLIEQHLSRLRGLWGLDPVLADLRQMTDMLCREAPVAVARLEADAVVCDQLEPAGALVARRFRLPCISVANALMIDREPFVPPPFTDWAYRRTPWGRERNLAGYRVHDRIMRGHSALLRQWCERWGIAPCEGTEGTLSQAQVGQMLQPLDFPREGLAGEFCYAGPLRAEADPPAPPRTDGRPYAFVSLGTLQGGRWRLFARITQACADLGLTAVVAHGGRLTPRQAAALPGRPEVHDFVPQRAVMAGASVVVTHGGLNTVLDAASLGIPAVLVPLALEQGAIAQRALRAGAALTVPAWRARRATLRRALERVLAERHHRDAAQSLAAAAVQAGGARRAADFIERHAHHA